MSDVYTPQIMAGNLNRRVTIEEPRQITDGLNPKLDWSDSVLAVVWAEVTELAGNENLQASQTFATAVTRFRIRHRDDVTVICRLKYNDRVYAIESISELGMREGLEILTAYQPE